MDTHCCLTVSVLNNVLLVWCFVDANQACLKDADRPLQHDWGNNGRTKWLLLCFILEQMEFGQCVYP